MDDLAGLYTATLKALGDTLVTMTSAEWDATMQDTTSAQRTNAARLMLQVQEARLTLANTALGDILDELSATKMVCKRALNSCRMHWPPLTKWKDSSTASARYCPLSGK